MCVRRNEVYDNLLRRQGHLGDCGVFLASWCANCKVSLLTILHYFRDAMQQNRYSVSTRRTYYLGSNMLGTRRYGIATSIKLISLAYHSALQHATVGAILFGSSENRADLLFDLLFGPLQSRRNEHLKYNHFRRSSMPLSSPRLVTIIQMITRLIRNSRTYSLNLMKIYTLKMSPRRRRRLQTGGARQMNTHPKLSTII
jgi:hypothetical protein